MNKKQMYRMQLASLANCYAEASKWLSECPFADAQPYYETADREMTPMEAKLVELANKLGDQAIIESIETAVEEGEYGPHDDEASFWRHISAMVGEQV